jgi:hypothetical protein
MMSWEMLFISRRVRSSPFPLAPMDVFVSGTEGVVVQISARPIQRPVVSTVPFV